MKKTKIKKKKSELHFLEEQILELIGDSTCRIVDLETKLIEHGINNFKPRGTLSNFLIKRPHLFGMSDTQTLVWSKKFMDFQKLQKVKDEKEKMIKRNEKFNKRAQKYISKQIAKNPNESVDNLFQSLPDWCLNQINSVKSLTKFIEKHDCRG